MPNFAPEPYIVLLALMVVTTNHFFEAWRCFRVAMRRPRIRRLVILILLVLLALSHSVAVALHAREMSRHISAGEKAVASLLSAEQLTGLHI